MKRTFEKWFFRAFITVVMLSMPIYALQNLAKPGFIKSFPGWKYLWNQYLRSLREA